MAASAVEESEVSIPPAEVVGNEFAMQYYMILEQFPAFVYRFYEDVSKTGHLEDGGSMSSTTTMDAINGKIQSYESLKAVIKFVDAQESYDGGVIVLVTGYMINVDDSRRGFTQTFFLAPQDKGYFILNDIFIYLEDDFHHIEQGDDGMVPHTPTQEASSVQETCTSERSNGEVCYLFKNSEVPDEEGQKEREEEEEEGTVVDQVVDETPDKPQVVNETNNKAEERPKKSYASIIMQSIGKVSSPNLWRSIAKMPDRRYLVPPAPSSVTLAPAPAPSSDMFDNENNQENKSDGHSIYLKNLPINVTYALVEEGFKRFGPIKSGGIQIRNNKGFCYGFVEFEVADAARNAIEASPIIIGGCGVVVEEKKSTRGNKGRFPTRRNDGLRGEAGRGRESYWGGRDYHHELSNNNDFGNRRGSQVYQSHSGGRYGAGRAHSHTGM